MNPWLCRKLICSRMNALSSRCSASQASYIRKWLRVNSASVGCGSSEAGSSVPVATATSVWSRFVVRPMLAEYAIASSALRFLSSKVCRMRRWYSARFGMVHARNRGERAVGADDAGPGERGCRGLEELLAKRVGASGSAAALVEEHRPVGHGRVDLGERRQAQLGEHPRRAGAHCSDELTLGHGRAACREQRQDLGEVRSKLPLRYVIAGTVREADEVRVALDEPRHYGAPVQIDDLLSRSRIRRIYSDRNEAAVADCHRLHHGLLVIHRVDAPVDEGESGIADSVVRCLRVGTWQRGADARREACLEEIPPRPALIFLHTLLLSEQSAHRNPTPQSRSLQNGFRRRSDRAESCLIVYSRRSGRATWRPCRDAARGTSRPSSRNRRSSPACASRDPRRHRPRTRRPCWSSRPHP